MTYNGWSNYETWNVALWLDNDEASYNDVREVVRQASEDNSPVSLVADALKDYVESFAPDLGATMFSDLLNAALSKVDWYEMAENYLSKEKEQ